MRLCENASAHPFVPLSIKSVYMHIEVIGLLLYLNDNV